MKKAKRSIAELSNDELDAMATHGGCFGNLVGLLHDDEMMPFYQAETVRLQTAAIDEMERRRAALVKAIGEELSSF